MGRQARLSYKASHLAHIRKTKNLLALVPRHHSPEMKSDICGIQCDKMMRHTAGGP